MVICLKEHLAQETVICELLTISVPLILCGLAITFAYKSGVLTIGVDGQLIMGAISAAWFAE